MAILLNAKIDETVTMFWQCFTDYYIWWIGLWDLISIQIKYCMTFSVISGD